MGDTEKCAFDDFFEGNKKPVLFEDNNHMHEDKKVEINQVNDEMEMVIMTMNTQPGSSPHFSKDRQ